MTGIENFQKSTIKIKCKDCTETCKLLYDRHHDQTFSITCGKVIMQSSIMLINYPANPLFWEQQKQRREEIKELKKILDKVKELEIPYTTTEDIEIILPELTGKQQSTLTNMCSDTIFKLVLEKKYNKYHEYLGSQFIIKKDKNKKRELKEKEK